MKKKLYFGTNLKMYKTIEDTLSYLNKLQLNTNDINREAIDLFVIPSYTSLCKAVESVNISMIKLGAQNMNWEDQGQFTGEISPLMLKELGIKLVMIGHSERRHVFGETDTVVNRKIKSALKHGFTALLCVGETMEEKHFGVSEEVLRTQLKIGLHGIMESELDRLWIAYEPVWAIGVGGVPASAQYAEQMHSIIKKCLQELFESESSKIPVLYGGSVNPDNATDLIVQSSIDGLFIGRSAWDADSFDKLIREALNASHHTY